MNVRNLLRAIGLVTLIFLAIASYALAVGGKSREYSAAWAAVVLCLLFAAGVYSAYIELNKHDRRK